jgi:hypothetical protein
VMGGREEERRRSQDEKKAGVTMGTLYARANRTYAR